MKTLILTISAGGGHHKTAMAIKDYMLSQNHEAIVIDTYKYFNKTLSNLVEKGYLLSTKYTPQVYGKMYEKAVDHDFASSTVNPVKLVSGIVARQFSKYIKKLKPDAIICTHVFPAQLVTRYKRKGIIAAKIYGVVTDFTVHPFWETTDIDYWVTCNSLLNLEMTKKGIPESRILPFGIPIEHKFSLKEDKSIARKKLGLKDKDTVFVIAGSMGYGDVISRLTDIDALKYDFQIVCVCGNNKHLKKEIEQTRFIKDVYVYGFVKNVDEIMNASDFIVTKPGGLTVSEALAKELPIVLINPIPGQEDRNQNFLTNNGMAIAVTKSLPIDEAVSQLYMNTEHRENMIKMAQKWGKPQSTKKLCDFIYEQYQKDKNIDNNNR